MPSDIPDKAKLLLPLEGLMDVQAQRVMRALGERFPQFRFDGSADSVPAQARTGATGRHDVFAHGPWHLSARERPAMDAMRMFAEGAAAMCRELAADDAARVQDVLDREEP